ncbi:helix-turn-helix transcriptional regulator [Actinoplanes siamensis]|uniref:Helix-turn-helix transcriptional regulator n=1 Tax=Actinoplanes siamensis TaxID=1223317 RepID=A0A919NBC3_9ACTN|nr:LuxR family transcriptional regulator [Actinoplanes siamensis]GIF08014.1 helix-turn-helix transcriptional regulator [Actinoplanes siamensis]
MQEVERLLRAAAAGHGGALVLCGAPGSGRSTLLATAAAQATGWTVRTVPGHAAERMLPGAALRRLAGFRNPRSPDDMVAAGEALLDFLRAASAHRPLLILLDDAHLLDEPSLAALGYAARRAADTRLAILAAGPPGLAAADLPVRQLPPLSPPECRALLPADITDDVATALTELSGGNPAALTELAGALSPTQRRGYAPLPASLPPDSPLRRRLHAELAALPPVTRDLVFLASADPPATLPGLLTACAGSRLADFRPAEQAGLITIDGTSVRFGSAVARSVAYREMPAVARRTVHLALAEAATAGGRDLDALLHRAAAATTADPALAAELTAAAAVAAPSDAAAAFRYAAQLTPDPAARDTGLLRAARAAWLAGRPHEATLLLRTAEQSATAGHSPSADQSAAPGRTPSAEGDQGASPSRSRSAHAGRPDRSGGGRPRIPAPPGPATIRLRARGLAAEMRPDEPVSREILMDLAAQAGDADPEAALDALSLAGEAAGLAGERGRYAALARRVTAGQHGGEPPGLAMAYHHVAGLAELARGDEPAAFGRFRRELDLAGHVAEPIPLIRAATAGIIVGDARRATSAAARAAVLAGACGAHSLVPRALELAALAGMASGDYDAATTAALDGVAVARETGQSALAGTHLGLLAVLAALVGDRDSGQTRIRAATGTGQVGPLCEWALALLDLIDGRPGAAAVRLHTIVAGPPGRGSVLLRVAVVPHLLEAAGPEPALATVATGFDEWAGRTGQDSWLALRDRCRALRTRDGEAAEAHFHAALRRTGEGGFPRAHTELLYGRLLRRRRRHVAAREHLRRAAETFRLLGADPWAAQSVRELRAAGERCEPPIVVPAPGPRRGPGGAALTAQQERIAALVAEGATNREVAQELHLSPRTVDHHLRNVFARLGVRSRTEMAHLLAAR